MTKRILEVDDEEVVILLRPKKDSDGDWNHSTNIHFPKKHDDSYDLVSAICDLARAMVGFSYGSNNEEIIEYTSHFYQILDGLPDEKNKKEINKKDNIIYLAKWNNDD